MIDRIKLSTLSETHFCAIDDPVRIRTKTCRTLYVETRQTAGRPASVVNIVQCRDYDALRDMQLRYADDCRGVANSFIEHVLGDLAFGLGDIRRNAHSLIIDSAYGTPSKVAAWLKKNCTDDVVFLEGRRVSRASFNSDDDYLLAKINFA